MYMSVYLATIRNAEINLLVDAKLINFLKGYTM